MAVSPIDIRQMQLSMEVAQIKRNEDMKPVVEQSNMVMKYDKDTQGRMEKVTQSDETDKSDTRHDAREKGKNFYFGEESEQKKKQQNGEEDGKVRVKNLPSFDMKI